MVSYIAYQSITDGRGLGCLHYSRPSISVLAGPREDGVWKLTKSH